MKSSIRAAVLLALAASIDAAALSTVSDAFGPPNPSATSEIGSGSASLAARAAPNAKADAAAMLSIVSEAWVHAVTATEEVSQVVPTASRALNAFDAPDPAQTKAAQVSSYVYSTVSNYFDAPAFTAYSSLNNNVATSSPAASAASASASSAAPASSATSASSAASSSASTSAPPTTMITMTSSPAPSSAPSSSATSSSAAAPASSNQGNLSVDGVNVGGAAAPAATAAAAAGGSAGSSGPQPFDFGGGSGNSASGGTVQANVVELANLHY